MGRIIIKIDPSDVTRLSAYFHSMHLFEDLRIRLTKRKTLVEEGG